MSCWIVARRHIDLVVAAVYASELVPEAYALGADALGSYLWQRNHDSWNDRYGEHVDRPDYTYRPLPLPDLQSHGGVGFVRQAVQSYLYQSADADDWEGCDADVWCRRVIDALDRWLGRPPPEGTKGWVVDEDYHPSNVPLTLNWAQGWGVR